MLLFENVLCYIMFYVGVSKKLGFGGICEVNEKLLREKIKKSGYKVNFLAECLGLTSQGLQKKLGGATQFNAPEVGVMIKLLKIDDLELHKIFFAD